MLQKNGAFMGNIKILKISNKKGKVYRYKYLILWTTIFLNAKNLFCQSSQS